MKGHRQLTGRGVWPLISGHPWLRACLSVAECSYIIIAYDVRKVYVSVANLSNKRPHVKSQRLARALKSAYK
jgi:hypothetical protein